MQTILTVVQIVLSILLSVAILTQQRGTGLSATFGGSGTFYTSKRGAEKVLFNATIVLGILFVANSIAYLFFV
ncbi:preprotein translocase subunit SecG [Candidatus Gracilibacteria bacterium]|jgi:preprotein translocase subunit SecG|nr:preprotein translocase subunit SecG [Candidatus Gracilibacteria bacterium]